MTAIDIGLIGFIVFMALFSFGFVVEMALTRFLRRAPGQSSG